MVDTVLMVVFDILTKDSLFLKEEVENSVSR